MGTHVAVHAVTQEANDSIIKSSSEVGGTRGQEDWVNVIGGEKLESRNVDLVGIQVVHVEVPPQPFLTCDIVPILHDIYV
mmetsp:Transcript_385/g.1180  ORF Transcript_385/g.1180 Transcript_385/m.1180 type:complete len:80 (+) Transcript_385:500-739(+)